MKLYPEHKLVKVCLRQIEDKLGWGNAAQWHNEVFIELSETIEKETHVLLSPTTLKRVWGRVNYENAPSISTLNALSQFAGYLNWRDFKNKVDSKNPSWIERKITPNARIIVVSASVLTLVFISLFSMIGIGNKNATIDSSQIKFSSYPIAEGIPNSVVFDFDLNGVKSDSIYIQQFWDRTKTIKIKPGQKQATGIYYYPGYFRAKLLIDGKKIKQHDLFIKSNGWLGTVDYQPIPKYIKEVRQTSNKLSLPSDIIDEIVRSEEPLVSSFHYVKNFEKVSGDNFVLNTTIKNVYRDKWAVCQHASIVIMGTKSSLIIPFSIPGCASELGIMLSETYLNGKEHDLSELGLALTTFKNIKIKVREKHLTLFAENEEIFSKAYHESIGDIAGIRYHFLGAGEVKSIQLTDISKEIILIDENFGSVK
ncbi:hypothetical protein [Allomuricauda sp. R78024]|uniref:hypothetical protein n=1 Tax=Allomuricauda sp. R78024 TaxID=3093867 RepID=UPI0037CB9D60